MIEGKKVVVFYNDLHDHVTRAIGIVTGVTDSEIILDNKVLIPRIKIVRIEIQND